MDVKSLIDKLSTQAYDHERNTILTDAMKDIQVKSSDVINIVRCYTTIAGTIKALKILNTKMSTIYDTIPIICLGKYDHERYEIAQVIEQYTTTITLLDVIRLMKLFDSSSLRYAVCNLFDNKLIEVVFSSILETVTVVGHNYKIPLLSLLSKYMSRIDNINDFVTLCSKFRRDMDKVVSCIRHVLYLNEEQICFVLRRHVRHSELYTKACRQMNISNLTSEKHRCRECISDTCDIRRQVVSK